MPSQPDRGTSSGPSPSTSGAWQRQHATKTLWGLTPQGSDAFVVALCALLFLLIRASRRNNAKRYPPGPKPLPIIGNALDIPSHHQWITFAEWGAKYGPLAHVEALGTHIVVINSPKIAADLLEKRSKLYSDRPTFMMTGEMVGLAPAPPLIKFGAQWAEYRRLMVQFVGTRSKLSGFEEMMREQAGVLVEKIRDSPKDWERHVGSFAGTIILLLTYGYESSGNNDRLVKLIQDAMDIFIETATPRAYSVDAFPILRFVPSWFPGAEWVKTAKKYRETALSARIEPYEWTRKSLAGGHARPSFVAEQLQSSEALTKTREEIIQWTALGMYGGGADTTVCGFKWFIQALVRHPLAQARAHAELDAVLGTGVLPTCVDRARLPYVEALYLESMRLYPIPPICLPHVNTADDVYEGYFIPKGTLVFPNVWQFTRDPETYTDPLTFHPERFLGPAPQQSPKTFIFGFGRRICPGYHLGDESMWLACASVLAAFEVRAPRDGKGVPIVPPLEDSGQTIKCVAPFSLLFLSISVAGLTCEPIDPVPPPIKPSLSGSVRVCPPHLSPSLTRRFG